MSEFRKQRLLTKLFDSLGVPSNPSDYSDDLFALDAIPGMNPVDEGTIRDLALSSADPERFYALAQSLSNSCELGPLMRILQGLRNLEGRRAIATEPVAALDPVEDVEPINMAVEAAEEDLEEISRKLNRANDRIGGIQNVRSSGAEVSSTIKIGLFKCPPASALGSKDGALQELFLVEDLLFVLMGYRGTFAVLEPSGFCLDDTIDPALIPIISPVLEVAGNHRVVKDFAQDCLLRSNGRVLQAFGNALGGLSQEFGQWVVALEKRFNQSGMQLGQLNFHLAPFVARFRILYDLVSGIAERKLQGGALIAFLEAKLTENFGDQAYKDLTERILVPTSAPFLDFLAAWFNEGSLCDPSREFMIEPNPMAASELDSFALRPENIPVSLLGLAQNILLIGIYRGILAKSHSAGGLIERGDLIFDRNVLSRITGSLFAAVNRAMLELLEKDRDGIRTLFAGLKKVFFVDQVDALLAFVEAAESELGKAAQDVDLGWLSKKFDLAFGQEEGGDIEMACTGSDRGLFDQLLGIMGTTGSGPAEAPSGAAQMRGFDVFSLNCAIAFPMNLVVSQEAISKYQLVFRLLFTLIVTSGRLTCKRILPKHLKPVQASLDQVKLYMLQFLQNFQTYLVYQVLQPQFNALLKNMEHVRGLDRIVCLHTNFLDTCLRQSLLTSPKLVQLLAVLFAACGKFATILEALATPGLTLPPPADIAAQCTALCQHFSKNIRVLLEALQYYSARDSEHHLGALLSQLDFNSHYYATAYARQHDSFPTGGLAA